MDKFNISKKDLAYIIKSLKMCRNDYYRKFKKDQNRELLILDKPLNDDKRTSLIDTLTFDEDNYSYRYNSIEDITGDEELLKALSRLTDRQREILYYVYVESLSIKEVSRLLNISRQVVNKTHNLALSKLKEKLKA